MERTYMEGMLMGTPGSNGLAIRSDEMRTSSWGGSLMRYDAPGSTGVYQEGETGNSVSEIEQQAAGRGSVYNPPAVGPFPAWGPNQVQGAWQWWAAAPNRRW